jgi:hypothetical protein
MEKQKFARRDFFRKAVQLTLISAMAGGTAYLLLEDRVQQGGCSQTQFCSNCQKISDCSLDQAKKFRQNEQ